MARVRAPLQYWADVVKWMFQHQKLSREEAIRAAAVKAVNALIDAGEHHSPMR
jgi:hypothetical protein